MAGFIVSRWKLPLYWFALGALLTVALIAVILFMFRDKEERGQEEKRPHPVLYSRSDFSDLVLGKTESEVLDVAGKPDQTSEDSEARYWHYHRRTINPVTKAADSDVQLIIQDGKVTALNY